MKQASIFTLSSRQVRERAISSLDEARFAIDSVVPVADEAIAESKARFVEQCLEEPKPCVILVDAFHANRLSIQPGPINVWLVTQGDPQSVFFDEATSRFGACWGPDSTDGSYSDMGFRTESPLEAYLA